MCNSRAKVLFLGVVMLTVRALLSLIALANLARHLRATTVSYEYGTSDASFNFEIIVPELI